ncbi:MAG: FadR family transcriptional regulator [Clostridiales bacterium]|nr:FadR family transcriptional regulator [Clostridiales bacterium]
MEKIDKIPLSDKTYDKIIEYFQSLSLQEGDSIPSENEFSKLLGVSRVVVRDALKKLRDEKVIVTFKGKGSFIANPENFEFKSSVNLSYENFVKIMRFRQVLECEAIKDVAKTIKDHEVSTLVALLEKMRSLRSKHEISLVDFEFHYQIVKYSNNEYFIKAFLDAKDDIIACFSLMNDLSGSESWSINVHEKLVNYLKNHDYKNALKILKTNEEYNFARIFDLLKGE